jgi:putative zinc finger/helix-turn-helix YgiT family protein
VNEEESMNCVVCGTGTARKVKRKNYPAGYNGEPVVLPSVEIFHCGECGEDFLTPEQAHALSVAVKNEVRNEFGLLPPERIKEIREKAGLTQAELEELLGQGPKVVVRWESGRVIQNRGADTVLRLLEREPNLVKVLRAIEIQRSKQQQHYAPHQTVKAHTMSR